MNNLQMKYIRFFLVTIILVVQIATAHPQGNVGIESKVDRAKILIGDVVRYSLRITHDKNVQVEMPAPGTNLGDFEIRDYQVLEPQITDDKVIAGADYLISTFDTGEYEIPPLTITYTVGEDTIVRQIESEPLKIFVQSLNPNEAGDIRDIKKPLIPPRDWATLVKTGLIVVVLIALGVALWWYIRRRKQGKSLLPVRQAPPRPAHEVALEALAALVNSDLLQTGRFKAYHSELADIVRRYIEGRYFIEAMEMTSHQLLDSLDVYGLDVRWMERLADLLSICDLAKFAKFEPPQTDTERITETAFDFVEQTRLILTEREGEMEEAKDAGAMATEEVH